MTRNFNSCLSRFQKGLEGRFFIPKQVVNYALRDTNSHKVDKGINLFTFNSFVGKVQPKSFFFGIDLQDLGEIEETRFACSSYPHNKTQYLWTGSNLISLAIPKTSFLLKSHVGITVTFALIH